MTEFIITGTDTDIGKTIFSAMLVQNLNAKYWKPIQSGIADGTDTKRVQAITQLPDTHFLPEAYVLTQPLSPHRAAEIDGVTINSASMIIPPHNGHLIIEGAGGLMVPVTRNLLQIDLFKQWNVPVILCARTILGTINHTLLSVESLRARNIPLHGIAFIGDDVPDTIKTITEFSGAKILGRLPKLDAINAATLKSAFQNNFQMNDFI